MESPPKPGQIDPEILAQFAPEQQASLRRVLEGKSKAYPKDPEYAPDLGRALWDTSQDQEDWPVAEAEIVPPDVYGADPEMRPLWEGPVWEQRTTYEGEFGLAPNDPKASNASEVGRHNIQSVLDRATPEEVETYKKWYDVAREQAKMLAAESGQPYDVVAAMLAAMSPGPPWEQVIRGVRRILAGGGIKGLGGLYPIQVYKALRVLKTGNPEEALTGNSPKVQPFYETLLDPQAAEQKAVVDRHMFSIWMGRPLGEDEMSAVSGNMPLRRQIQGDTRAVAAANRDDFGKPLTVQAVQAITWHLWRSRVPGDRPASEPAPLSRSPGLDDVLPMTEEDWDAIPPPELTSESVRFGAADARRAAAETEPAIEDLRASAEREVEEEIGALPPVIGWAGYKENSLDGEFRYTTFVAEVDKATRDALEVTPDEREVADVAWFKLDELPDELHPGLEWLREEASERDRSADLLPGGIADDRPDSDFDPGDLERGITVELEHTDDEKAAKEITKDHIVEARGEVDEPGAGPQEGDEEYYKGLLDLERKIEERRAQFDGLTMSKSRPEPEEVLREVDKFDALEGPTTQERDQLEGWLASRNRGHWSSRKAAAEDEATPGLASEPQEGIESIVVVLPLDKKDAASWPERGADEGPPHFTLAYIEGRESGVGAPAVLDDQDAEKISAIVSELADKFGPRRISLTPGAAWFTSDTSGEEIAHKRPDALSASWMADLARVLRSALRDAGYRLGHSAGFRPHATLGRAPERGDAGLAQVLGTAAIPEGEIKLENLAVWGRELSGAEREPLSFPLDGVDPDRDLVVTLPKGRLADWADEGDEPGSEPSGMYYAWHMGGKPPKHAKPGNRVYVVHDGKMIGYAPLVRIEQLPGGGYNLIRGGEAVACTIDDPCPGFRGVRYRWWPRSAERPFPEWRGEPVEARHASLVARAADADNLDSIAAAFALLVDDGWGWATAADWVQRAQRRLAVGAQQVTFRRAAPKRAAKLIGPDTEPRDAAWETLQGSDPRLALSPTAECLRRSLLRAVEGRTESGRGGQG